MKSDFLEFIGNARQRRSEKFRVQLVVFLICLVLSIFIWSLVRLSKDYYYSVDYRLDFTNSPNNLRMISFSDSVLTLKLKIQGFEFFSEQFLLKQNRRFDVDLKNVRLRASGEHSYGYLLTNRIGKEIVSQSSFPSDMFFVTPDTLFFEFERQSIKRMPSKPTPGFINSRSGTKDTILIVRDSLPAHPLPKKSAPPKH
jgi:hypothetical protein